MPMYRATIIINGKRHGHTESHIFLKPGISPGAFAATLVPLLQARANLLSREYQIDGCRVAAIRDDAGNPVKRQVFPIAQVFKPANGFAVNSGAAPNVGILLKGTNAVGDRYTQFSFAFIPDNLEVDAGEISGGPPNWPGDFITWNGFMLSLGAGWLGFVILQELPNVEYTSLAGDLVQFTIPNPGFDPGTIGTNMMVRFRGFNNGKSVLNRELKVFVVDANTCVTVAPIAAGPMTGRGVITIYDQPSTYFTAAGWGLVKISKTHPGRPLLVSPGRAKTRPRV